MREPRIRLNRLQEEAIQAAYEWRAADVHAAACRLGIRNGDCTVTRKEAGRLLSVLRVKIDILHHEEKSLGLI
jgi:hypothetical protein